MYIHTGMGDTPVRDDTVCMETKKWSLKAALENACHGLYAMEGKI